MIYLIFLILPIQLNDTLTPDSVALNYNASTTHFLFQKDLDNGSSSYSALDTSVNNIQYYNPALKHSYMHKYLGNIGTACQPIIFNNSSDIGINYGSNPFENYTYKYDQIPYYYTCPRFSELFYVLGSNKEQFLKIKHTQNANPYFNFGLNYQRIFSEGTYQQQKSDINSLALHSWVKSPNNRYNLISNAILNSIKVQENGGIFDESSIASSASEDRKLERVNLTDAENRWRSKSFYLTQYFDAGFKYRGKNDTSSNTKFRSTNRFSHSFLIEENSWVYEDNDPFSGFYKNSFFDSSNISHDSAYFYKIENDLSFKSMPFKQHDTISQGIEKKYQYRIKIKHSYWDFNSPYITRSIDTLLQNFILSSQIESNNEKNHLYLSSDYIVNGTNQGDYKLESFADLRINKKQDFIKLSTTQMLSSPNVIESKYLFNFFRWENSFKKTSNFSVTASYGGVHSIINAALKYSILNNYIYFDTAATPQQLNSQLNILQIFADKKISWKKLNFINHVAIQSTSKPGIIRIPVFYLRSSFYYESFLFKGAMFAQVGVDGIFYSAYNSDAYMPASRQFYLQDKIITGNTPVINFFLNIKVKRARLFFKIEHLNYGISGFSYYDIPQYPMPDRSFRLGVNWMFFD